MARQRCGISRQYESAEETQRSRSTVRSARSRSSRCDCRGASLRSAKIGTRVSMSACGTKRQFARCKAMSGVGGKADLPVERRDFSLGPKADIPKGALVCAVADFGHHKPGQKSTLS